MVGAAGGVFGESERVGIFGGDPCQLTGRGLDGDGAAERLGDHDSSRRLSASWSARWG